MDASRDALSQLATKSDMVEIKASIKTELLELENRLIKWGVGLALGQTAVIAALVKLL